MPEVVEFEFKAVKYPILYRLKGLAGFCQPGVNVGCDLIEKATAGPWVGTAPGGKSSAGLSPDAARLLYKPRWKFAELWPSVVGDLNGIQWRRAFLNAVSLDYGQPH